METTRAGEYLTFRVARQDFVLRSSRIRALLPVHELIPLDAPAGFVTGVIGARGRDCPVLDLAAKLGIPAGSPGRQPCVIVAEAASPTGVSWFAFVADRISDVVKLRERDFRGDSARVNGRTRRVLDPDALLDRPASSPDPLESALHRDLLFRP
ncbi:MAG TPA: chemotaxis protein CheW [Bryobacteraceae bacterium]|nr:chemotaxis protein CheW [Bryobacteraceae bacterium]